MLDKDNFMNQLRQDVAKTISHSVESSKTQGSMDHPSANTTFRAMVLEESEASNTI